MLAYIRRVSRYQRRAHSRVEEAYRCYLAAMRAYVIDHIYTSSAKWPSLPRSRLLWRICRWHATMSIIYALKDDYYFRAHIWHSACQPIY